MNPATQGRLRDHYDHPRNVGSLQTGDPNVSTATVKAKECGDLLRLQIRLAVDGKVIRDAKFKAFGCGPSIASGSFVTEWLKGRTLEEASRFNPTTLIDELGLTTEQTHCARLVKDAIDALLADARRQHPARLRR